MDKTIINTDPRIKSVFENYPKTVRPKIEHLRKLILEVANEIESVSELEETLKWGEPSYLTKKGSTLRIDWKSKTPEQYAMYFKCTSQLVPTFKIVFKDLFQYENNRAIVFQLKDTIPEKQLKECIKTTLIYHSVKQIPLLGL